MYKIYTWVEQLVTLCGVTGVWVVVLRHLLMALVAFLLSWLTYLVCRSIITPAITKLTRHTPMKWDDTLLGKPVLQAICRLAPALMLWTLLPLVFLQLPAVREAAARLTAIYITVMTAALAVAVANALSTLQRGQGRSSRQYLKSFLGVVKIIVICLAAIVAVAIAIGKSPLTLFAGLGAASAVLMLVFKDTIEGLVAGIRLTSADMVHVGDWITVPAAGADGTVIEITLSTVKIQNFDNTITTVSPISLVNGSFQNWKGMQENVGRRVLRKVWFDFRSLHYLDDAKTKTNLTAYRHAVEQYIKNDPRVCPDQLLMVRQQDATQGGLPVTFMFFLKDKTWENYEENASQIMEHAFLMAADYGLTIYQQHPLQ